jgi:thiamine monophosphate synthase
VSLPPLLVLTDRAQCRDSLPRTVALAVEHGARAVVLREKDAPPADRAALAAQLSALLRPVAGVLILAGAAGDRVHLAAADPLPRPRPALCGRSCHDPAELARARAEGCDYVTLSPVFPSASKPGYGPALGLSGLARLCHRPAADRATAPPPGDPTADPTARGPAAHPRVGGSPAAPTVDAFAAAPGGDAPAGDAPAAPAVYALAGVRPDDVAGCLAAGAAGVAVMGAVMRDPRIVHDYLSALREERQ